MAFSSSCYHKASLLSLLFLLILGSCCFLSTECRNNAIGWVPGEIDKNQKTNVSSCGVNLTVEEDRVIMDNGIVKVTLSNPGGQVLNLSYQGLLDNITQDGYWDLNWSQNTSAPMKLDKILGTKFEVIVQTEEQLELSFVREWDPSLQNTTNAPINIDKRYIMLKGESGFYVYGIYERPPGFPACVLIKTRIVFRLNPDRFEHMAIGKNKSRLMPTAQDRDPARSLPLAYKEAVLLTNPTNPLLKGEVDDKYQYSMENKHGTLYGWFTTDPKMGFWIIFPSIEFRNGGPTKQSLTAHTGPTTLVIWQSGHYMTAAVSKFAHGERWNKVFGPVYVYLNHNQDQDDVPHDSDDEDDARISLWDDASEQSLIQQQNWPYSFPNSSYFLKTEERSNISGRLLVYDRFIHPEPFPADTAYIGLAAPGRKGTWQNESKGYQFWTTTNSTGHFEILNVRPGNYNVFGWVPKIIGDYMNETTLLIASGTTIDLQNLTYEPPRNGSTVWEIGIADRSAAEFYIPDPSPKYINRLYLNDTVDRFRQYGLWERYGEIYNETDLIFTVGECNYTEDWFFAHVTRKGENGTYQATTWQIRFSLPDLLTNCGDYTFHIAIASSQRAMLQVRFNDMDVEPAHAEVNLVSTDNAIARHGIHGTYHYMNLSVNASLLRSCNNTIFLTQPISNSPFNGILYDYIRMDQPQCSYS